MALQRQSGFRVSEILLLNWFAAIIINPGVTKAVNETSAYACEPRERSDGQETYLAAGWTWIVLDSVGQFPPREAPEKTATAIVSHFRG
jgi:hypothetical protein